MTIVHDCCTCPLRVFNISLTTTNTSITSLTSGMNYTMSIAAVNCEGIGLAVEQQCYIMNTPIVTGNLFNAFNNLMILFLLDVTCEETADISTTIGITFVVTFLITAIGTIVINTSIMWFVCIKKHNVPDTTNVTEKKREIKSKKVSSPTTVPPMVYEEIDNVTKTEKGFEMNTNVSYGPVYY